MLHAFVCEAHDIVRAWGFHVGSMLTWCKAPRGIGFGGTFVNSTELVLFCRRGTLPALRRWDTTWFNWKRPYINGKPAHSCKPDGLLDVVELTSPGPYLEMFSRRARLGWATRGNEALHGTEEVPHG